MADQLVLLQRDIRRAVESPLKVACDAQVPPIPAQWKGIAFNSKGKTHYISTEFGMPGVVIHEVGPNPMIEGTGFFTMNLHSPIDAGEDANDVLLAIVAAAYPLYSSLPVLGLGVGHSVKVDKMQQRGYGSDGPWLTGLVSVDWNIYRRS